MSISASFIKDLAKGFEKLDNVSMDFSPPTYWYSTGNLALNNTCSGSFARGIPEGRVVCLAGPSGSGKSFLSGNIMKNAQDEGAFIFVMDSENALDQEYLEKIGVSTDPTKFMYTSVVTIQDVVAVFSEFIKKYEKEFGRNNPEAPKVLMVLDSIDMLLTESENDNFERGEQKGDQGQRAKQMKHMLRTVVSRISRCPITFLFTHQVYAGDPMKGEGVWAINNAVRYCASIILLITKLKLKEESEVVGIRMRVETFKSRFAKIGSNIEIEVPYDTGMNPFSGILELLEAEKVVVKGGSWYTAQINGEEIKFQRKNLDWDLVGKLLSHPKISKNEEAAQVRLENPVIVEESPGE